MINKIQSKDNICYRAGLSLHRELAADKKVYEEFWKRTGQYSDLVLSQEMISTTGKDLFFLKHRDDFKIIATANENFTSILPLSVKDTVNQLIGIFNQLKNKV